MEKRVIIPKNLFNVSTFGTLTGCAMVTWVASNVCTGILNKFWVIEPALVGLLVAILVSYSSVFLSENTRQVKQYVVAFFNGFLIYVTVVGFTSFTPYLSSGPQIERSVITASTIEDSSRLTMPGDRSRRLSRGREEISSGSSRPVATPQVTLPAPLPKTRTSKHTFKNVFTQPWISNPRQ